MIIKMKYNTNFIYFMHYKTQWWNCWMLENALSMYTQTWGAKFPSHSCIGNGSEAYVPHQVPITREHPRRNIWNECPFEIPQQNIFRIYNSPDVIKRGTILVSHSVISFFSFFSVSPPPPKKKHNILVLHIKNSSLSRSLSLSLSLVSYKKKKLMDSILFPYIKNRGCSQWWCYQRCCFKELDLEIHFNVCYLFWRPNSTPIAIFSLSKVVKAFQWTAASVQFLFIKDSNLNSLKQVSMTHLLNLKHFHAMT